MTSRSEYLRALSEAPALPLTADVSIPGLGSGEWTLPALWAIQERTKAMLGDGVEESLAEGREFADHLGPWRD